MVSLLQPSQGTNSADLGLLTSRTDNAVCCLRPPVCNSLLWQLSPQGIGSIAYFFFLSSSGCEGFKANISRAHSENIIRERA